MQDLLLRNPECIFKYENKYFSSIVAANFVIIYLTESGQFSEQFVKLEDNLTLSMRAEPKAGYTPVIHVDDISIDTTLFEEVFK